MQQAAFYSHSIQRDARRASTKNAIRAYQGSAALWRVGVLTPGGELDTLEGVLSLELWVVSYGGATPGSVRWIHKTLDASEFTTPETAEGVLNESEWNAEFSLSAKEMLLPVNDDGERSYWYEIRANFSDPDEVSVIAAGVIIFRGTSQSVGNVATAEDFGEEQEARAAADVAEAAARAAADAALAVRATTLEEQVASLLYVPMSVSLSNNVGTVEAGTPVTSVTLTWSANKQPVSASFNQGIGAVTPPTLTTITRAVNLIADTTFTITVDDGTAYAGHSDSASTAVTFRYRAFWGTTDKAPGVALTSADIRALEDSALATGRARSFTVDAPPEGAYVVYAYLASYGPPSKIQIGGLDNNNWEETGIDVNDAGGNPAEYRAFRLEDLQLTSGINIQFF